MDGTGEIPLHIYGPEDFWKKSLLNSVPPKDTKHKKVPHGSSRPNSLELTKSVNGVSE